MVKELKNKNLFTISGIKMSIFFRQYVLRKIEIPYLEFFVTTRCTLKCECCSNRIPFLKGRDYSFMEFRNNLDTLLSKISVLYRLKIHGGEVFLNPDFATMLKYADSKKKIKSIRITTNGSIIPSQEVIQALKSTKVLVQISDYALTRKKAEELMKLFDSEHIQYAYLKEQKWIDLGDFSKRDKNHYKECSIKRCTSFLDGKIYVCSRAAVMSELSDVIPEFVSVSEPEKEFRRKLRFFYKNEEHAACLYCNGDADVSNFTEPGRQVKN